MVIHTVINKDILDKFIMIGDNIEKNVPQIDIKKLNKYNFINRTGWKVWEESIKDLDDNLLIKLYKGMIYVERELNWMEGSVAAAVWIAMFLAERRISGSKFDIDYLRDWTKKHTQNDYIIDRLNYKFSGYIIHP